MSESFKDSRQSTVSSMQSKKNGRFFLGDYRLFSILLLTAYCLLITSAFADPPSPFAGEKLIDRQAPAFELKDIDGSTVSLSSYKGTVVLLNFWATWCPSCREEFPSLNKLSRQLKNKKFSVIAVSIDRSVSDVRDFMKKYPSGFTVVVDHSLSVSKTLYKVFVLPTSFLIDKKGVIVEKYYGEEDWAGPAMVRKIESLL